MDPQSFMAKHVGRIEREKQMQRYETSYTASHRTASDKYVPVPSDSCSEDEDDDVERRNSTPSTTYTRESKRPYSGRAGSINWTSPPTSDARCPSSRSAAGMPSRPSSASSQSSSRSERSFISNLGRYGQMHTPSEKGSDNAFLGFRRAEEWTNSEGRLRLGSGRQSEGWNGRMPFDGVSSVKLKYSGLRSPGMREALTHEPLQNWPLR
mmetsp:Transcript_29921/g.50355  ORF Transcript_29921/g.50355 Transcript_29921/m.50355 type:complete len:209 (+) Transcript_29921:190-816(+)